jgi:alpha-L-rhamnosidase
MLVGDLVIWLYEDLAGIQPDDSQPGFKHIVMHPHPVGDLTFVKASFESPYGPIRSEWHRDGKMFDWQVSVPANTSGTVYIPAKSASDVREGGQLAGDAERVKFVKVDGDCAVFEIESGDYRFSAPVKQ